MDLHFKETKNIYIGG